MFVSRTVRVIKITIYGLPSFSKSHPTLVRSLCHLLVWAGSLLGRHGPCITPVRYMIVMPKEELLIKMFLKKG